MRDNSMIQDVLKRNKKLNQIRSSLKGSFLIRNRSEELQSTLEKNNIQNMRLEQTRAYSTVSRSPSIKESVAQQSESDEFFENYELKQKIGEGCNATVHHCIYKSTGKSYAVKKIKIEQQNILSLKKDFITLKELHHPTLCRYKALYIIRESRLAYLVMEYLPYPSLQKIQISNEEQLRMIVREILGALQYLHSRHICHRDIKPENILFDITEKKIKIIDFGISKKTFLRGQRRDMLTIIGTHLYMAPEIFQGGGYDERVDLWALGVSIFKMVTGKVPFEDQYYSDSLKKIRQCSFDFNDSKWSKYSSKLQSFIQSLLKKVNQRITLAHAERHVWLLEGSPKKKKIPRISSLVHTLHEHFHDEFHQKLKNHLPKQEGSKNQEKRLLKSIKVLQSNFYSLEDSDDQNSVVTPMNKYGDKIYPMTPQVMRTFSCEPSFDNFDSFLTE